MVLALCGCTQAPVKKKDARKSTPRARSVDLKSEGIEGSATKQLPAWWGKSDVVVVDVRTTQEYVNGHIQGAQLLDFQSPQFQEQVAQLDKKKTYLLYCASGSRAGKALRYFKSFGLKARNLGSLQELQRQGLPTQDLRR